MRSVRVIGAVVAAVLIAVLAEGAAASGTLPASPTYLGVTRASGYLKVMPTTIVYTGDGTGILAGAHVRGRGSAINWTRWNSRRAFGTGYNQLNNCEPSCAGGHFTGYPVRIELWRPRWLAGNDVFTRLTIFYQRRPPRGEPRHYTFTDTHNRNGYGWGPPDAQGYCVHTYGLKPQPTCRNIHSLP